MELEIRELVHDRHDDCLEDDVVVPVRLPIHLLEIHPSPVWDGNADRIRASQSALGPPLAPFELVCVKWFTLGLREGLGAHRSSSLR